MGDVAAIVLAAGKGTRMKSSLCKVLHGLGGRPMVLWPVTAAQAAGADKIVLVVGHQSEEVRQLFASRADVAFAMQEEQLGTGHAVATAASHFSEFDGTVLILCGDVPLIRPETLQGMVAQHRVRGAVVSVMTTHLDDPFGYGRIVKREGGRILQIVEEKDASEEQKGVNEINAGIYCVDARFLFSAVKDLKNDNAQGEYYLTDIVKIAHERGGLCLAYRVPDSVEVMGVNDRVQLAGAAAEIRNRIATRHMLAGVTLVDPATTYIDHEACIGIDTIVSPNVYISGSTVIGESCLIEPGVVIKDSQLGSGVTVKAGSVISGALVRDDVSIGPMAHLRPGTELLPHVKIGNFVETKKTVMGEGSKASHLTYLGDAFIGSNVNIGCGTITCNYDGVKKHVTTIEDDVFVGSDVQFVAPVKIGRNSLIAAGTTVTVDVPPDSLALARVPQVNKEGWRLKKK